LLEKADQRICIMPGAGIRANNIAAIAMETNAAVFHSSAITTTLSNDLNTPVLVNKDEVEKMLYELAQLTNNKSSINH
jgi:copper homeostasis protein CutC